MIPSHVLDRTSIGGLTACWFWRGALSGKYGTTTIAGRPRRVHRYFYEVLHGPIPAGRMLHHTCEEKLCVNPRHLVPVTAAEHQKLHDYIAGQVTAEKWKAVTLCKRGHEFSEDNTRRDAKGRRVCLTCERKWYADNRRRRQDAQNAVRRSARLDAEGSS